MLVKCISREKPSLTINKIYEVSSTYTYTKKSPIYYTVKNDWGNQNDYYAHRFIVVKLYPNIPFFRKYLGEYKEYKGMIYGTFYSYM